ncbi:MAG: ribose-5-phosphate isomerase RpiA [Candidatus Thermoplasmatota archaeon]|nr:ribose-5-phosphate isomerase RpiA [Candidatus Thermoplasmatota archaeon]
MEEFKRAAAEEAVELIEDGMVVGLGTGSTVSYAIKRIGEMKKITGVPTSIETEKLAKKYGIRIGNVEDFDVIDIDIDGADEIDRSLNLSKGLGGALYREKVVALMSRTFVVVADESKLVGSLGEKAPVSVELLPFGHKRAIRALQSLGCRCDIREKRSDNGNMLVSCYFGPISEPSSLVEAIKSITGVVEHGLFIGMASKCFIGGRKGVTTMER